MPGKRKGGDNFMIFYKKKKKKKKKTIGKSSSVIFIIQHSIFICETILESRAQLFKTNDVVS